MIIDPRITDLLEEFGVAPWSGEVWRHVFNDRDPLDPTMRQGRWAPEALFPILYTSLTRTGAVAEANHLIAQYSIPPSRNRVLARISVNLERVLDLSQSNRLTQLGVDMATYAQDPGNCPDIGAAANLLEVQGILAPSARIEETNLMVLTERLDGNSILELMQKYPLTSPGNQIVH